MLLFTWSIEGNLLISAVLQLGKNKTFLVPVFGKCSSFLKMVSLDLKRYLPSWSLEWKYVSGRYLYANRWLSKSPIERERLRVRTSKLIEYVELDICVKFPLAMYCFMLASLTWLTRIVVSFRRWVRRVILILSFKCCSRRSAQYTLSMRFTYPFTNTAESVNRPKWSSERVVPTMISPMLEIAGFNPVSSNIRWVVFKAQMHLLSTEINCSASNSLHERILLYWN